MCLGAPADEDDGFAVAELGAGRKRILEVPGIGRLRNPGDQFGLARPNWSPGLRRRPIPGASRMRLRPAPSSATAKPSSSSAGAPKHMTATNSAEEAGHPDLQPVVSAGLE